MKITTKIKLTNWPLIIDLLGDSYCRKVWKDLAICIPSITGGFLQKQVYDAGELFLTNKTNNIEDVELNIHNSVSKFFQDKFSLSIFRLTNIELISYEYKYNFDENLTMQDLNIKKSKFSRSKSKATGELKKIIDNRLITPYLQGIYDTKKQNLVGYEALSRGPINSSLFEAKKLFSAALSQDATYELELICLERILNIIEYINDDQFISINISPYMLLDNNVKFLLDSIDNKFKVKLELTEHIFIPCWEEIISAMNKYRMEGFEFWLDDVGCGYFNFETIKIVNPELTKIGMTLIDKISHNYDIIKKLKLVTEDIHNNGGKVLAEGIENLEQLKIIREINIDYVQGFIFDSPNEAFEKLRNN
ncbi:EAL domain-containing protein [Aliivibrio sp. EL58]|uniref:EAL domain-containing protein n=1 Tax=Aliivibrio sp. EL58 TaxID=2107582 RepID=UPI000EFB70E5|nr:EAL domain-containing protein [Aliivibrio sp. EL58]